MFTAPSAHLAERTSSAVRRLQGVAGVARTHDQCVGENHRARGDVECRLEYEGAVEVAPRDLVLAGWPNRSVAAPSSTSRAKIDVLSKRGRHSQSTEPARVTRAAE
jgi:hypothetical protein